MSRVHRGQGEAWLRGGQTVSHTWDMVLEVIGRITIVAIIWAAICVWMGNSKSTELEQTYGIQAFQAATFHKFGYPFPQEISIKTPSGIDHTYRNEEVANLAWIQPYAQAYFHNQRVAGLIWLFGVVSIIGLATVWFIHSGEEKLKARQIRGQTVVGVRDLLIAIHAFNRAMALERKTPNHVPAKIVGLPYPYETEQEHTFFVGSPGSGKSQAIHQLIESIRSRGDRAITYDPELDYIRAHYNPDTDLILNPYDGRSVGWNPYNDAVEQHEIERLAVCLFKEPKGGDPYWTNSTRQVFVWATFRFKVLYPDATLEDLLKVFFGPIELLMYLLRGTPAASHLEGGSNPRSDSIKSVLSQGAGSLVHLVGQQGDFSIRKWVNKPEKTGGFLFMSAPETHIESLRPLLGFWSELVVSSLLGRGPTDRQANVRYWRSYADRLFRADNFIPFALGVDAGCWNRKAETGVEWTHANDCLRKMACFRAEAMLPTGKAKTSRNAGSLKLTRHQPGSESAEDAGCRSRVLGFGNDVSLVDRCRHFVA